MVHPSFSLQMLNSYCHVLLQMDHNDMPHNSTQRQRLRITHAARKGLGKEPKPKGPSNTFFLKLVFLWIHSKFSFSKAKCGHCNSNTDSSMQPYILCHFPSAFFFFLKTLLICYNYMEMRWVYLRDRSPNSWDNEDLQSYPFVGGKLFWKKKNEKFKLVVSDFLFRKGCSCFWLSSPT